jgi:hypothetical protein
LARIVVAEARSAQRSKLTLLDAVFHLAAGAVDIFIKLPSADLAALERGDR